MPKAWHRNAQTRNRMLVRTGPDRTGTPIMFPVSTHVKIPAQWRTAHFLQSMAGSGGSAGARNGPAWIARNSRRLRPVRNRYTQNGTRSATERTRPDQTGTSLHLAGVLQQEGKKKGTLSYFWILLWSARPREQCFLLSTPKVFVCLVIQIADSLIVRTQTVESLGSTSLQLLPPPP